MPGHELIIEGAKQNNLKNISLALPHNKVIAITGVSGSGKSSLAFDTIFAEGQWRFIESLSTYARLFLEKLDRPDVEAIHNIRPAIALEQRNPVKSSRSTVGTATEIYDYLRLLYSKISAPHCPKCGRELKIWEPSTVVKKLIEKYSGQKALILFESGESLQSLKQRGFHRIWIDGEVVEIQEAEKLNKDEGERLKDENSSEDSSFIIHPSNDTSLLTPHSLLFIVLDRLIIKDEPRLSDSVEIAWKEGNGKVRIEIPGAPPLSLIFSSSLRCHDCDIELPKPHPLLFSFNHPLGACPECKGFGNTLKYSEDIIIPDKDLSLADGAIEPWSKPAYRWWYRQFAKWAKARDAKKILDVPYKDLPAETRELIFKGNPDFYGVHEFFEELEGKRYKLHVRVFLSRYRKPVVCSLCGGNRLQPGALSYKVGGLNIAELSKKPLSQLSIFFSGLRLLEYEREMSAEILRQINLKLNFLLRVGLGYLTQDRLSKTLSGGESQRINLSGQLASRLTGTLYVLDEPTVGLHPRDVDMIAGIMRELADIGNTIIAVEHDKAVINSADWITELGPGGGGKGGRILFSGWRQDFLKSDTLTAAYLNNTASIPVPKYRKRGSGKKLFVKGACGNNLKHIDINIPLQTLTCITGVSGSGKSTIVGDTLYNAVAKAFKTANEEPLPFKSISGIEYLKGIKIIDQYPIGKSPRSNPVTYIKAFDPVRKLFANTAQAKNLGFGAGHFSFNTEGGRCEACAGAGYQRLEMYFFEDLYVKCEECGGRRYKPEVLEITYNGKNIHDILEMTVEEAVEFFSRLPSVTKGLKLMASVGLGYLKLGQPATTLSGGEAQRLKICAELRALNRRDYLYILDEPTVGLHPDDIKKLLGVLNGLVDAGNTVLLVEHNLDVIKCADWVIDLGPEGGNEGGSIVAEGTPEDVATQKQSHTGKFLKEYLA
ncbi:MAG: excinuclease ABC subunit UvrA [Nitrospirae bacterium]|nr:excinuclease ABC subunit UvrA [Nitrospirota bacterium]